MLFFRRGNLTKEISRWKISKAPLSFMGWKGNFKASRERGGDRNFLYSFCNEFLLELTLLAIIYPYPIFENRLLSYNCRVITSEKNGVVNNIIDRWI